MSGTDAGLVLTMLERLSRSTNHALASGKAGGYLSHRERSAERQRAASKSARDIGFLPPVQNPERKALCRDNFKLYLTEYHPDWFTKAFSLDHNRVIAKIQTAVMFGGLQAIAMPRGTGKSALCNAAAIWAAVYGWHRYLLLLQANQDKGKNAALIVKLAFEVNENLIADFPEVCYPIYALERKANRAKGQLFEGKPTYIQWEAEKIVLPTIPGSAASGVVIGVGGILEAVRGAVMMHPATGQLIRPSFSLIDDPQTRESANSPSQNDARLKTITDDVLGCAGPGEPMSALIPCTVIAPGDAIDTLLDPDVFPHFRPERCKMLNSFPANLDLWAEYDIVRRQCFRQIRDDQVQDNAAIFADANQFYLDHLEEMDRGAQVSWEDRKYKWNVSAIQHAMDFFLQNPVGFYSEYQNDPQAAIDNDNGFLTKDDILVKFSGYDEFQIPTLAQKLVAHIDVHQRILYYTIFAFTPYYEGFLITRGTFPKQNALHFTERNARPTLQTVFPTGDTDSAIYKGIETLVDQLFKLRLKRVDGGRMPLDICGIDTGYKNHLVKRYCEVSPYGSRVVPTRGRDIGPDQPLLSQCRARAGEHIGTEWTIQKPTDDETGVREIQFDTNSWKTFFHQRLATPIGSRGAVSLFGRVDEHNRPTVEYSQYAEHLLAEYSTPLTGMRTADVWKKLPGKSQNHWFDNSVACMMLASVLGLDVMGLRQFNNTGPRQTKRKISYPNQSA